MLSRTYFAGSEFGIFEGFGWVCNLVLVDEPGFGRVSMFGFSIFGPGFGPFLTKLV